MCLGRYVACYKDYLSGKLKHSSLHYDLSLLGLSHPPSRKQHYVLQKLRYSGFYDVKLDPWVTI